MLSSSVRTCFVLRGRVLPGWARPSGRRNPGNRSGRFVSRNRSRTLRFGHPTARNGVATDPNGPTTDPNGPTTDPNGTTTDPNGPQPTPFWTSPSHKTRENPDVAAIPQTPRPEVPGRGRAESSRGAPSGRAGNNEA